MRKLGKHTKKAAIPQRRMGTPVKSWKLLITGSIAAIKAPPLARLLAERGAQVEAYVTQAASQWVTAHSLLQFGAESVTPVEHMVQAAAILGLGTGANTNPERGILIAPTSANALAQLVHHPELHSWRERQATGQDSSPLYVVPAMNVRMWEHPSVQRNVAALLGIGVCVLGPVEGSMACGDTGPGRMLEPEEIVQAVHDGKIDQFCADAPERAQLQRHAPRPLPPDNFRRLLLVLVDGAQSMASIAWVRQLREQGMEVQLVASEQVSRYIPLRSLATLSGRSVVTDHYTQDPTGLEHLRLSEWADAMVILAADTPLLRELAQGAASSFITCLALASDCPVWLVPRADSVVEANGQTLKQITSDGVGVLDALSARPDRREFDDILIHLQGDR